MALHIELLPLRNVIEVPIVSTLPQQPLQKGGGVLQPGPAEIRQEINSLLSSQVSVAGHAAPNAKG